MTDLQKALREAVAFDREALLETEKIAFESNDKDYWESHAQFGSDPELRTKWYHGCGFDVGAAEENARLAPILAALERCVEALKFYTLKCNFEMKDEGRNYSTHMVLYELDETTYMEKEIGTRANAALETLRKALEAK